MPAEQRLACLKYLLVKEMQTWGSEEESEEGESSGSEISGSSDSDSNTADSVGGSSDSGSSSSSKRGLLRRARDSKSSPPSSSSSTDNTPSVISGTNSASSSNIASSSSNTNSRGSGAGGGGVRGGVAGGGSIFQAVIFVDNGAYATVVYETATAALQAFQRLQPPSTKDGEGVEKGIVTYLSDTGSLDERAAALNAFREGKAHILVCSDIAARGLDVPNVSHVFQVTPPPPDHDHHSTLPYPTLPYPTLPSLT